MLPNYSLFKVTMGVYCSPFRNRDTEVRGVVPFAQSQAAAKCRNQNSMPCFPFP